MLNTIKNALALMFPSTVDSITAGFNRDIKRLKTLASNHRAVAEMHTTAAHDFLEYADEAHAEALRADRIAARVAALID
jgi:hypothetical protein